MLISPNYYNIRQKFVDNSHCIAFYNETLQPQSTGDFVVNFIAMVYGASIDQ